MKTAILVDGGFYRKRAQTVKGRKTPEERAFELYSYCTRHLNNRYNDEDHYDELYRIFYYDCSPIDGIIFNPLTKENIDFSLNPIKVWTEDFFKELSKKRKVAMRFGELSKGSVHYNLKPHVTKKILAGRKEIDTISQRDLSLSLQQKGVDMRIGLDIASLAFKKQVGRIVLIAGDSDFVPAAKLARREGIDFILDSLGKDIKDSLSLHIDGRRTCDREYYPAKKED